MPPRRDPRRISFRTGHFNTWNMEAHASPSTLRTAGETLSVARGNNVPPGSANRQPMHEYLTSRERTTLKPQRFMGASETGTMHRLWSLEEMKAAKRASQHPSRGYNPTQGSPARWTATTAKDFGECDISELKQRGVISAGKGKHLSRLRRAEQERGMRWGWERYPFLHTTEYFNEYHELMSHSGANPPATSSSLRASKPLVRVQSAPSVACYTDADQKSLVSSQHPADEGGFGLAPSA